MAASKKVFFGNSRLSLSRTAIPVIVVSGSGIVEGGQQQTESKPVTPSEPPTSPAKQDEPRPADDQSAAAQPEPVQQTAPQTAPPEERRSFWERVFKIPPMRERLEKALTENWKLAEVRPRHIEWLMTDEAEDARAFFLDGLYAKQYQKLFKEYRCGFQDRNGRIVDDSFDTLRESGPELIRSYHTVMENRELIKKYFAGVFRDGRIGTESLIRISNSMWFSPFAAPTFKRAANVLGTRFQVPNHVIGPMLASVGDSIWLQRVLFRRTAPQEFRLLLNKIAPSSEGSGNAFAPALQLLVLGEEHKIPFKSLDSFVGELDLKPRDFGPFSAAVYNLGPYRLANEIKCPTFASFLRRILDEFGQDINQESARLFLLSFREFKDDGELLQSFLSPQYSETKAFIKSLGVPITSNVWNMERIVVLTRTLTPKKREKISQLVRELSEEVKVADIMFLSDICDNDEELKLLLNRQALLAAVREIQVDRIVERSQNDLVKELEREIDIANRNGFYRTVRRLTSMVKEEKRAYTERVDPDKMTNIQISRLLIFHRSIDMPGFLNTVGWNVSLDLQNDRSEGGGYLGYDKDMAMVTMVAGQPGDNRQYRPQNLFRAPASLALFHNHAFKDTFAQKYLGFLGNIFPFARNKNKSSYAGPSGWLGAEKGDITAAAESELPSFIITKIGYPENPDGSKNKKSLLVNFDWVVVDRQTGEALRSDRGVFAVPHYGDEQLGKLKWPSKKEQKRQEREKREKCPAPMTQAVGVR